MSFFYRGQINHSIDDMKGFIMAVEIWGDEVNAVIVFGQDNEVFEASDRAELFQFRENSGDDVIRGFDAESDIIDLIGIDIDEEELTSEITEEGFLFSWDGGSVLLEGVFEDVSHLAVVATDGEDTDIIFTGSGSDTIIVSDTSNAVIVGFDTEEDSIQVTSATSDPEDLLNSLSVTADDTGVTLGLGQVDTFLINVFDTSFVSEIQAVDFSSLF